LIKAVLRRIFFFSGWLILMGNGMSFCQAEEPLNLIDLELNQIPVSEAFMMLGEVCGKNIMVSSDVGKIQTNKNSNPEPHLDDMALTAMKTMRISASIHQKTCDESFTTMLEETGLVSRQTGDTVEVGSPDLFVREEESLVSWKKIEATNAPLVVQSFPIQFGNAAEILEVLKDSGWLSARVKLTIDVSLNTLLVQGTSEDMIQIKSMLKTLDVAPVQVLIEARMVEIDEQAMKAFGVSLLNVGGKNNFIDVSGQTSTGISNSTGNLNLTLGQLPAGISLDLAIQALETQGKGQVVSAPNLLVSDGQSASIEQGAEVPYATESQNGNSQVQFKKAVMGLIVTPRVINNEEVLLNLEVNKDAVSSINLASAKNEPLINTQQIKTQVRVLDGHTVVLGGIIETNQDETRRKVPFLGDLPGIGILFQSKENAQKRKEIVIFVTPVIKRDR
jgi:type IV pilus assembly protein PilQ